MVPRSFFNGGGAIPCIKKEESLAGARAPSYTLPQCSMFFFLTSSSPFTLLWFAQAYAALRRMARERGIIENSNQSNSVSAKWLPIGTVQRVEWLVWIHLLEAGRFLCQSVGRRGW